MPTGRASRPPPICNAARSLGTPGVGIAGMPRRGAGERDRLARAVRQGIRLPTAQVPIAMPTGRASRPPPVCNAARSFGTPGVGLAGMPRRGGRGRLCRTAEFLPRATCGRSAPLLRKAPALRRASLPSVGPCARRSAAPGRARRRVGQGLGSPPRKSRAPCPSDADPVPRPFAMPLGPSEPPGWGLPGCPSGVVGRASDARPGPALGRAADVLLPFLPTAASVLGASVPHLPRPRTALPCAAAGRPGTRVPPAQSPCAVPTGRLSRPPPVCNAARSFVTPGVGLAGMPPRGGGGRRGRPRRPRPSRGLPADVLRLLHRAGPRDARPDPLRKSLAPCPRDARPGPSPLAMPLCPFEPPPRGFLGCPSGVVVFAAVPTRPRAPAGSARCV